MKTIKNQLKRAFTIVELVIVIAVVAALAAILIPTFVNVLNSANESNDTVLAKNLDTSLITVESKISKTNGVYNVTEALSLVRNDGYDVSKLTPTADNADYVYNASKNRFLYYTDDFKTLAYGDTPETTDTLVIIDTDLERVDEATSTSSLLNGLTVQYCVYSTDDSVTVESEETITVWIYGESNTTFTVNLPNGTVKDYSDESTVDITAIYDASYHVYGSYAELSLTRGHIVLESGVKIGTLNILVATGTKLTYSDNATVESFNAASGFTAIYNENSTEPVSLGALAAATGAALEGSENNPYEISNADEMSGISTTISKADSSLSTVYFKLTANITLTSSVSLKYKGVLDLNGYTITAKQNSAAFLATWDVNDVSSSCDFTIKDSVGTGTIFAENSTSMQFINFAGTNSKLTLESGSICSNNCTWTNALIYLGGSKTGNTFTMNGGSISVEDTTIKNGAVIKLAQDSVFTMNNDSEISVVGCTINNGSGTTFYNDNAIVGISKTSTFVLNSGSVSATDSTIYNGLVSLYTNGSSASDKTTFTMNGGTLTADSTVKVTDDSYTPAVAIYNKLATPTVTISGGTISAYNFCIAGNGNFTDSESLITIEAGSTLTSTTDFAIYNPQPGTVNVTGGTISGGAGAICMNRGTLNISGGTLVSENTGNTGNYTSGTGTLTNAVINLGAKYDAVTCTISGGTLTASGSAKVITVGTSASTYSVTLNITGTVSVNGTSYTAIDGAYVSVTNGYTLSDGTYTYSAE